jgi:hypothetical protein
MQLKRRTGGGAFWIQHPARCSNCRGAICQGFHKVLRALDARDAEPWLSENDYVVFKFWASDFPKVSFFSGNSPAIR